MGLRPLKINKELTIRDSRAVDLYFQEINKIPVLTPDEEAELCQDLHSEDEARRLHARDELVRHNLKFVISVAKRYQSLGYRLGDLIAIGNIGLIRAAEKFDPTKGFKFISYAVWWIRQQIMSEVGFRVNGVKLPSNRVTIMYKISKFREKFYKENDREPFLAEIADEFGIAEDLASDIIGASTDMSSLNELAFDDDDGKEIVDNLADNSDFGEDIANLDSVSKEVKKILSVLTPKQRLVVGYHFGLGGKTLDAHQIAEATGLRLQDVKKSLQEAIDKMKKVGQKL